MTWLETFLGSFAGSYLVLGLLMIFIPIVMLLLLRVSKVVFTAVIFVGVYALAEAGYIPMWIFGLLLMIVGVFIGKMLLNGLFGSR